MTDAKIRQDGMLILRESALRVNFLTVAFDWPGFALLLTKPLYAGDAVAVPINVGLPGLFEQPKWHKEYFQIYYFGYMRMCLYAYFANDSIKAAVTEMLRKWELAAHD